MVEIEGPPRAASPTPPLGAELWKTLTRDHPRPIGVNGWLGFSCLALSHPTGGCFGLARAGFEFGWGDLHVGGLFGAIGESSYDPFTGRSEGSAPTVGLHLGFEAGSPFMRVSPRVQLALRGVFDHDLLWGSPGHFSRYVMSLTHGATARIEITRRLAFVARLAVGLSLFDPNLVLDAGVGIQYAR
jgi:hypothetical protein